MSQPPFPEERFTQESRNLIERCQDRSHAPTGAVAEAPAALATAGARDLDLVIDFGYAGDFLSLRGNIGLLLFVIY